MPRDEISPRYHPYYKAENGKPYLSKIITLLKRGSLVCQRL
jgi:hypothetical protein